MFAECENLNCLEIIDVGREPDFCWPIKDKNAQLWKLFGQEEFGKRVQRWVSEIARKLDRLKPESGKPRVSVVIPARNEQKNILQVLVSVAEQKGFSAGLEVIVVDNNSDRKSQGALVDDLGAELARMAGVKVVEYHKDGVTAPVALARQIGLEQASGEIIITTDADAIVPPEWVLAMFQPLSDSEIAVVNGYQNFYSAGLMLLGYDGLRIAKKHLSRKVQTRGNNMAFRRCDGLSDQVGGYDLSVQMGEDSKLGRKLLRLGRQFIPDRESSTVWVSLRRILEKGCRKAIVSAFDDGRSLYL